jgi:hypothetical protein
MVAIGVDGVGERQLQSAASNSRPARPTLGLRSSARRHWRMHGLRDIRSAPPKPFLWQNRQNRYMKSILPCFAALALASLAQCALAQPPAAADAPATTAMGPVGMPADGQPSSLPASTEPVLPAATLTAGDQLLLQTMAQLERHESLVARVRYQVSLEGNDLSGVGGYWQQEGNDGVRVRLELQFSGTETSLLQVSNGRYLWTDRHLPSGRVVTGLDLRRVRAQLARESADVNDLEPGHATWTPMRPDDVSHYGGLPKILAALTDSFEFAPPQAMHYTIGPPLANESTIVPVYATVGHWKADRLAEVTPKSDSEKPKPGAEKHPRQKILARIPQEVLLLVRQSDLFPCRMEFRQILNPTPTAAGEVAEAFQLTNNPMALVEFCDVQFDVPIAAGQFDFSVGDTDWKDLTDEHLDKLRGDRRREMATRRGSDEPAKPRR